MRRRWVTISVALFFALLAAGVGLGITIAPGKSFSLPRVRVEAALSPDGTMRVVEHLTYDFTGRFSFGTRPIPVGPYTITDMLGGLGVAALALQAWVGGAIALAAAAVQLSLTPVLRQRSPGGQRRYQEWLGVRRFLTDFSQLADAPAGHLVLWERYLVYAVALGVSDELAHGLATKLPEAETAQFAPWYVVHVGGSPGYGSLGDFSHGFATSAVAPFTPASSSGSGFGGGFSGGGGGGGGGGGIGAG